MKPLALMGLVLALGLAVVPDDGGCSGNTLRWVFLEPLAETVGVKAVFREDGALAAAVVAIPLGALSLGAALGGLGLRRIQRARDRGEPRHDGLFAVGSGMLLASAGGWALVIHGVWL
ncbi:MAG: hypothetical protein H6734_02635 [Alphaproteobacteria bacterium]|nr:hypothetical protein [Alphaproteobacteria bacterium]